MKRMLACIITLAMIFTLVNPGTAFARSEQKIKLTEAIDSAKSLLDIKTDNYNFNYNYNENLNGLSTWELNWSSKNSTGGGINVSVNSETGEILNFNSWDPYTGQTPTKIPKYSKEKAYAEVQKFISKVAPTKFSQTILKENKVTPYDMPLNSDTYSFNFVREINGLDFSENGINVSIDKNTLKIRNYTLTWDNGPFADPAKVIGTDSAKAAFAKKLGLELAYNIITDYNSKTQTPILVYSLKDGGSTIDALTGEVLSNNSQIMYSEAFDKAVSTNMANSKTPEEQTSVDNSNKYISKEAALAVAKKYVTLDDTIKLNSSNLYVNDIDNSATWNFYWDKSDSAKQTYSYLSANVDAITGKIKAFSMSGNDFYPAKDAPANYTTAQAITIAENFLKELEPDKFKTTSMVDNTYPNVPTPVVTALNDYNFSYVGNSNGAKCSFNNFNIGINAYTGKVMNYNMSWNDVKLPSADGIMKLQDAYNKLYEKAKFNLKYIKIYNNDNGKYGNSEIKLAYVLDDFTGMLDAKEGTFLDGNGKPVVAIKAIKYTDIKGNESENDINLLVDMGIIDDTSDTYNPSSPILQKDLIKMLVKTLGQNYVVDNVTKKDNNTIYDPYYTTAIQKNIITEAQKKPEEKITRQEGAKLVIRTMGLGYLGEAGSIYNLTVKDTGLISSKYKGYVALATGLNILTPISGNFYGTKTLTRGQTATMLVNYLKVDTNK